MVGRNILNTKVRYRINRIFLLLVACILSISIYFGSAGAAEKTSDAFVVRVASPLEKIFRDTRKSYWLKSGRDDSINVSACRGESESFQVVVIPNKDLKNVRWEIQNSGFESGNIRVQPVGYVYVEHPIKPTFIKGYPQKELKAEWWPDPLFSTWTKIEEMKAGVISPIWVTIDVPQKIKPGGYKFIITFCAPGSGKANITVNLKVWDFELPDRPHLKTSFWYATYQLNDYYPEISDIWEIEKKFLIMALNNRITPVTHQASYPGNDVVKFGFDPETKKYNFDFTGIKKRLALILDGNGKKGNLFDILPHAAHGQRLLVDIKDKKKRITLEPFTKEYEDFIIQYISAWEKFVNENGWKEFAYISYTDEPGEKSWGAIKWIDSIMRKNFPELRNYSAINHQPSVHALKNNIDIIIPGFFSNFTSANLKDFEELQRENKGLWGYICWKTACIDFEAIDHRIWPWICWKYDLKGFLYWGIMNWSAAGGPVKNKEMFIREPGKRWPLQAKWEPMDFKKGVSGDGYLMYPSPSGEPWSSIRLETIRDGIEDYEYFCLLREYISILEKRAGTGYGELLSRARKLLEIEPDIVSSPESYTHDYSKILSRRENIGNMIETMRKLVLSNLAKSD